MQVVTFNIWREKNINVQKLFEDNIHIFKGNVRIGVCPAVLGDRKYWLSEGK